MPPTRQNEIDELKKSLDFQSGELSNINKKLTVITEMMAEIKELKTQNIEKDMKIAALEKRLDDCEQYSRINDLIVSGLKTKPPTYARAAAATLEEPTESDIDSIEDQVISFLERKGIKVDKDDLEACHPLSRKDNDCPPIIIRFISRKRKIETLKQGKKLRGSNVYLNEHLTKRNGDIARKARFLRKHEKIQGTWTNNCKIYIKLNGESPEDAKVLLIKELSELQKYE